jgi:chromosome segregation ATPase
MIMHHIIQLEAENFKRLNAVRITPKGKMVIIGGKNEQGKTSVLDAITAAIGGAAYCPEKPIKHGKKKAQIILKTETLEVKRIFTAKGSKLEVKSNGEKLKSPQTILDELIGQLTFDPLEFGRADKEKQVRILRELAGIDLDMLDSEINKAFEDRKDIKRELKGAEARLSGLQFYKEAGDNIVNADDLLEEIERRDVTNRQNETKREDLEKKRRELKDKKDEISEIESDINKTEQRLSDLNNQLVARRLELKHLVTNGKKIAAEVNALEDEPLDEVRQQLKDIESTNIKVRDNYRYIEARNEVEVLQSKCDAAEEHLESLRQEKAEAIQGAEYPVEGIEAHDDGVYLNDVPWSQGSKAERIRAGAAIGVALNKDFRVMLVPDGSLLDEDSLKILAETAEQNDLQFIIERVGDGQEISVVIEDGEVKEDRT